MADMEMGDSMTELAVTPDRYLPNRYAGASGDFNPIHIDPEFARQVGLPGAILHGLYVMGLVSRAVIDSVGGDPRSLEGLSVQFRGMSFPEQEIVVTGEVTSTGDDQTEIDVIATQSGNQVIRNAVAKVTQPA